jgi:hypothetical protein
VNYFINQRYYAEVLCVNKAVKNSCCKGKCAMQKELTDVDRKESDQPARSGNRIIKLGKAEEALLPVLKLTVFHHQLISWLNTASVYKTVKGNLPVLLKPPAV